ncbi:glucose-6-phosphate dehydrogenase [Bartonella quintana]|uniref:Glucose-6-phosphate 1-dehydrogenase n=2 Tax=Bartonella quintana TaxID=803 RepID=W3TYL4_BARQI|nr:glucose-6-phosphate dehydrogenase [Bartonella quintana]ETS13391.1 glucose-6-phosphate dehydrogenase [Bartonella quintana BQ2-D70]ETS13951.1 glucose-6-phosphate dehydrogenase [Bartonella quintana JK 73rel]ETS15638.1 glucose-6-phosphate dehydrogenase [Bartonella quintana JK 73]ETS17642.1 glucose-6-phosphate dehydrogenase [Bartonella quintana JK 7]ETS18471.1 glucose-6-phosphate dehydrogenase [Bartonella quintana JK 12]
MVRKIIPVSPFDCIVFGGNGDLASRKLIPALYHCQCVGQFSEPTRIIGVSRSSLSCEEYQNFVRSSLEKYVHPKDLNRIELNRFLARLTYVSVDITSNWGWEDLAFLLSRESADIRAFYLAVSSSLFGDIAMRLGQNGFVTQQTRIIIEKPIGHNVKTAVELNDTFASVFDEDQIFRIDHYLGKETVQNLMALRFVNTLYEPLWNSKYIDHVQITVAESLGLEGRAEYYESAGALRDMVQNHMLQLLCLVAMEIPFTNSANAVRDEKLKVLHSLMPLNVHNVEEHTVRGQYLSGLSDGVAVKSYLDDLGKKVSQSETFVALKIKIDNWRWADTPFYLRTGKRMFTRMSEIVIVFKPIPHNIFDTDSNEIFSNRLVVRLQPDEGVKQWLMIKDPGPGGMRFRHIPLDMSFASAFSERNPDAYERLLMDVIRGNQTLFMRRDEVEAAWLWIDPILEGWEAIKQPVYGYSAGSWGPSASTILMERDGRIWNNLV